MAGAQHGVIHLGQIATAGMKRGAMRRRVDRGSLHRVHPAVYAVGHDQLTLDGRILAAVLACGDGAVASHRTAAFLHRVLPVDDGAWVDVSCASGAGRALDGVVAHRSVPEDVVAIRRIPATGINRCLLDLGDLGSRRLVADAFHEAQVAGIVRPAELRASVEAAAGRRGCAALAELLAAGEAPVVSRSELERRFLALCRAAGLPLLPRCEVPVGGFRVDFLWPDARLVVEVDGIRFHENDRARRRDRRKDRFLTLRHFDVLRYDWSDVTRRQVLVAAELAGALAVRQAA